MSQALASDPAGSADLQRQVALLDLVDRILEKGAVIRGQLVIAVADVDLVKFDLSLLLGAADTLERLVQ